MYLLINNNKHGVQRRLKTEDTVKYLCVTPPPEAVSGVVQMYRDDGFLLSEDNAADYERVIILGSLVTLTNAPDPAPAEPTLEEEIAAAIEEGVNSV